MKKVLLLAAALLLISSAASAGWLDIFADTGRTTLCHYPPPIQYYPLTIYLYARPPADGFRATECKIVMPDPCGQIVSETYHADMNLTMGNWQTGMSVSFAACQLAPWTLVVAIQYLSLSCAWSPGCQVVDLLAHDESGFLGFATCASGYPPEAAGHQFDVYLNCDPCPDIVATHEKSWGAIKNLYSE